MRVGVTLIVAVIAGCAQGRPDRDIGQCRGDTECEIGEICNPCSLRCISDPGPVADGEFAATFDVATEAGELSLEQNALGRIQWQGEPANLCFAVLTQLSDSTFFLLTKPASVDGARDVLQMHVPYTAGTVPLDQTIPLVDRYIREERDLDAYGFYETNFFAPEALALRNRASDLRAVVDLGEIRFDAFDLSGGGVRGAARGVLRPAGPQDLITNSAGCYDDNGVSYASVDRVVDPRSTGDVCVEPFSDHSFLGAYTCRFRPDASLAFEDGTGSTTFRFDGSEQIWTESTCEAIESDGQLSMLAFGGRVRDGRGAAWGLSVTIPLDAATPGTTLNLPEQADVTLFSVERDSDGTPQFGSPVQLDGRLGFDQFRRGERGYVSWWVSSGDGTEIQAGPNEGAVCVEGGCTSGLTCQVTPFFARGNDRDPEPPAGQPTFPAGTFISQCVAGCDSCSGDEACLQYTVDGSPAELCARDVIDAFGRGCDPLELIMCGNNGLCYEAVEDQPAVCLPNCGGTACAGGETCYQLTDNPDGPSGCFRDIPDFSECFDDVSFGDGFFCRADSSCVNVAEGRSTCLPDCDQGQCAAGQTCSNDDFCFQRIDRGAPCGTPEQVLEGLACDFDDDLCVTANGESRCRQVCTSSTTVCAPGLTCQPLVSGRQACLP